MERLFGSYPREDQSEWLSMSDLMAGLMVIFLFIAIVYLRSVVEENARIVKIADTWQSREQAICKALREEFQENLEEWQAEIVGDREDGDDAGCGLLIRFKSPETLFEAGQANLRPKFRERLDVFFPRYVKKVLHPFKDSIREVRIEGHTSSDWEGANSEQEAYFLNMELSQERTREVLRYSLELTAVTGQLSWLQPLLTANGLSSSHIVSRPDGKEDREKSRRVEFRILTDARTKILGILEEAQ